MKKLFLIVSAIASIAGGEALARFLFNVTGPDEVTTACAILIAAAIGGAYHLITARPSEAAAVRLAKYEGRRDQRFAEIDANNFMLKYEIYSADLERRGSWLD